MTKQLNVILPREFSKKSAAIRCDCGEEILVFEVGTMFKSAEAVEEEPFYCLQCFRACPGYQTTRDEYPVFYFTDEQVSKFIEELRVIRAGIPAEQSEYQVRFESTPKEGGLVLTEAAGFLEFDKVYFGDRVTFASRETIACENITWSVAIPKGKALDQFIDEVISCIDFKGTKK